MAAYCNESGMHFKTEESMTKYWRIKAHEAFDEIWKRKVKHKVK